jgi:hypothetical protein
MNLHILDARGCLADSEERVRSAFAIARSKVGSLIDARSIDCSVYFDPEATIPEVGIGAYTDDPYRISVAIDPANQRFNDRFEVEFVAAVAHECHHALRMRSVGYGRTLGEAIVSEGLACHFETELRDGDAPFYATALTTNQIGQRLADCQAAWNSSAYLQAEWFFGSKPETLPRFYGYCLGFAIVDHHVRTFGHKASALVNAPAASFQLPRIEVRTAKPVGAA